MRALFAALALGLAVAGPAEARPLAGVTVPGPELDRLVRLLVPDDAMADLAARAFDRDMAQGRAGLAQLYRRYPGLKAQVDARVRPQLLRILKRELPSLRREIGAILAKEMTPSEVSASATFFASPTGRKVYARALQAIGENSNRSEADASAAAMQAVMSNLGARDLPAVLDFSASGAAARMRVVNPKVSAASRAWAERVTARNGARIRKLARRAADAFVARAGRGHGR